jgi:hypothetical protein
LEVNFWGQGNNQFRNVLVDFLNSAGLTCSRCIYHSVAVSTIQSLYLPFYGE